MVKKLVFLIVMLSCAPAVARQCPNPMTRPTVFIREVYGETQFNYSKTSEEIRQISTRTQSTGEHHTVIKGLTVADFRMQLQMDVEAVGVEGGVCVYPVRLWGYMGYDEVIIYVDRKYPMLSCQRYVIEQHERQHAMINNQVLHEFLPGIVRSMTRYVENIRPAFIPVQNNESRANIDQRVDDAHREISSRVFKRAEQELQPFYAERERRNALLDTDESYERDAARCLSW